MSHLPVLVPRSPSSYEYRALQEIELWKQPKMGWFGQAVGHVNRTLYSATDLIRKIPGVDWTIDNVVTGLLDVTNEIVQDSVWRDAIYLDYRANGHLVYTPDDIRTLDLEAVDEVLLDGLGTKYRSIAAAEGAVTGLAGAAGILPDIVALVSLNLRAAGEYATYCGFDITTPAERYFALQVLNLVSQPTDITKQAALVPVIRAANAIARQQTVQTVQQFTIRQAVRNVARALGINLTERKLAQTIPVAGAFVGAGFNAYFTSKVCDAAFFLYRERFLMEKYGLEMLDGA